jgi:hypothetical protein
MTRDPPRVPHAVAPRRARVRARPPNALGLTLSTRTASEAARGALMDRLLEAAHDAPPGAGGDAGALAPERVLRVLEHDPVRRAAEAYVQSVIADGVAPEDAVGALRDVVREGAPP